MHHFDVKQVTDDLIECIRDWFERNGKDCNAVLGISGGKGSIVAAALCVLRLLVKSERLGYFTLAPISLIVRRYAFYHTQDWDYVINDILSRPSSN